MFDLGVSIPGDVRIYFGLCMLGDCCSCFPCSRQKKKKKVSSAVSVMTSYDFTLH